MMELTDQRKDIIERQREDVIRQMAPSSEYSVHVLRVMNQPMRNIPQRFNLFDTHSDDVAHSTQDDLDRLNEASTRTHLSRILRVNESLNKSLHDMNNDLPSFLAS